MNSDDWDWFWLILKIDNFRFVELMEVYEVVINLIVFTINVSCSLTKSVWNINSFVTLGMRLDVMSSWTQSDLIYEDMNNPVIILTKILRSLMMTTGFVIALVLSFVIFEWIMLIQTYKNNMRMKYTLYNHDNFSNLVG